MPELVSKAEELAKMLDGQVVSNTVAVQVCIKGILSGFPVKLEAIQANYPFGVNYFVETSQFSKSLSHETFKLVVMPKYARGKLGVITRFIFFERRGQKLDLDSLDKNFVSKYDNSFLAKKFVHYPDVAEHIENLGCRANFNEMVVKSNAGIYLSQSTPFNALNLEECKETFTTMTQLAQVLFDCF